MASEETVEPIAGREGGCVCGEVRYRLTAPALTLYACHCTDCQRRSGGAYSLSLVVPEAGFEQLRGEPELLESHHDDRVKHSAVCPRCHVRLWVRNSGTPGILIIKAGTLDASRDLAPVGHVWVRSKHAAVPLPPDAIAFDTQPTVEESGPAIEAWMRLHPA